jgi:hypothetical protein
MRNGTTKVSATRLITSHSRAHGRIQSRERLGGLLKSYYRPAAPVAAGTARLEVYAPVLMGAAGTRPTPEAGAPP